MILNSKFDVLRGWPREGAIDSTFVAHAAVTFVAGDIVYVEAAGTVAKATSPANASTDDSIPTWIVVEGNDDFSGSFVGKVVCLRANAIVKTANFVAGSWTPGSLVSFDAGQFKVAAQNKQVIGEVLEDNSTVDGTVTIYYHGGGFYKVHV